MEQPDDSEMEDSERVDASPSEYDGDVSQYMQQGNYGEQQQGLADGYAGYQYGQGNHHSSFIINPWHVIVNQCEQ